MRRANCRVLAVSATRNARRGGGESFGERSWLVGVARSAPDAPGARRVVLHVNDFRASGKWVSGPRSILATRPRRAPIATPGAAAAKKAKRPLLRPRTGQCGSDPSKKAASTLRYLHRVFEADLSMPAATSGNRRANAVLRGSAPGKAKVEPFNLVNNVPNGCKFDRVDRRSSFANCKSCGTLSNLCGP